MKKIILGLTVLTAIVLFLGVHSAKAQTSTTDTTAPVSYTAEARPVSFFERMKLRFIFKQEKKAEMLKEFSQRNFELAQKKLTEGKDAEAEAFLKKSDDNLSAATDAVSKIKDEIKQKEAIDAISAAISTRTTVLSALKEKVQNPVAKEAIERVIIRHAEDSDKSEMKIKSRINDLRIKMKDRDNDDSDDNEEEGDDVEAKDLSAAAAAAGSKTRSSQSSGCGGTSLSTATISRNVAYPNQTVVPNTTHFKIGSYKLKNNCAQSILITSLNVGATITGTNSANFPNAQAYINGVQQGTTHSTLYPFAVNYTLAPSQIITIDFYSDIGPATTGSIQTGLWVSGTVPSSGTSYSSNTASGQLITINGISATLVRNNSYPNQTTTLPVSNFKIGSWNLTAGSGEGMLLTTLSFDVDEVVSTEFDEGDITNMYAVVKVGGNIVAQTSPIATVIANNNNFSINYSLPINGTATIELFGNLSDDGSDSLIDIGDVFKTDLTVSGIGLVSGTTINPSGDIDGQTISYGHSTITATIDASTPVGAIVHDNQTVTSAAFKFSAINSIFNINALTLTIPQSGATVVQNVKLYDGATLIASQPGAATVTFNGLSWNVPANSNKVLTVKFDLGTVGIGAGATGASLLTTLTNFTAVNMSTGVSLFGTESNPAGNAMYAYAAIPTIANVALPSTTLLVGTQAISKFSVISNGGTVGWKKLSWTINRSMSGTDTLATPTLWDANTNTQIPGVATFTGSVNTDNDTAGGITFVATNEQQISGTKTYVLKVMAAFTPTTGDSLSTSIQQPSSFMSSNTYAAIAGTSTPFVWSDISASAHGTSTLDWAGSYLVRNLPTNTQTLTVN